MTFKFNGRGSFVIKKRFKAGIGEIRRASGTSDRKTFNSILKMLQTLYDRGQHNILREIRDGVVSGIEVYGYWMEDRLDHLPDAASLKPIIPTVIDWFDGHSVAPKTKTDYKNQIKRMCDEVGVDLSINDLPRALKRYRTYCIGEENWRTFNLCRNAVRAYLNNTYGPTHTLYTEVCRVKPLEVKSKKPKVQLTVVEFSELVAALPEPHADIARAMVLTGMRVNEVFGKWWCEEDRVVIKGTKTKGSERIAPLIQPLVQPARRHLSFRKALKKFRDDLRPYALRHTCIHWMREAGITRPRRMSYLGQSNRDVHDIYEKHEVDAFLKEDADKLRKWIFDQLRKQDTQQSIQILPVMDKDEVQSFLSNPSDATIL